MDRQQLAAWLRLLLTPGVGNGSARKLLAAFGFPWDVFAKTQSTLADLVSTPQAAALLHEPPEYAALLATTWDWLQAGPDSNRILALGDALYPKSLLNTEDPPVLIFGTGMAEAWEHNLLNAPDMRAIAVFGSRNPSTQGAANAYQFSQVLAEAKFCIVSGLALGVDGAAHEGALSGAAEGALATVAVAGTGLDCVYPAQHLDLAHRIAQRGVLLSEFVLGTSPLASNFHRRNRIISGMSTGALMVEASLESDSLTTARVAVEQGRKVFAIRGTVHSFHSSDCQALIKQGAKVVQTAKEMMEELQFVVSCSPVGSADCGSAATPSGPNFDGECSALLQALGFEPMALDGLQARTGLPTTDLLGQLMALEAQGVVMRLAGGLFQRMALA